MPCVRDFSLIVGQEREGMGQPYCGTFGHETLDTTRHDSHSSSMSSPVQLIPLLMPRHMILRLALEIELVVVDPEHVSIPSRLAERDDRPPDLVGRLDELGSRVGPLPLLVEHEAVSLSDQRVVAYVLGCARMLDEGGVGGLLDESGSEGRVESAGARPGERGWRCSDTSC